MKDYWLLVFLNIIVGGLILYKILHTMGVL